MEDQNKTFKGTVSKYIPTTEAEGTGSGGYGFINVEDSSFKGDLFFHFSHYPPGTPPTVGDRIQFNIGPSERFPEKPSAKNIEAITDA
mgnify:CR=1 FL=1|tara:strand:- start:271 stop:534 length:264 start_codon:yes stop_codon:yes gene_type:complete